MRTIPTYTGNTASESSRSSSSRNHPHIHGEYDFCSFKHLRKKEPSPYAQGILIKLGLECFRSRNIPTCVGNTGLLHHIRRGPENHPHMRGEYLRYMNVSVSPLEPSPHAWGILRSLRIQSPDVRTIPTCVGNTRLQHPQPQMRWNHPHMRGEYRQ